MPQVNGIEFGREEEKKANRNEESGIVRLCMKYKRASQEVFIEVTPGHESTVEELIKESPWEKADESHQKTKTIKTPEIYFEGNDIIEKLKDIFTGPHNKQSCNMFFSPAFKSLMQKVVNGCRKLNYPVRMNFSGNVACLTITSPLNTMGEE